MDPVTAVGTNANPLLMLLALIPAPYSGYAVSAFSIATTVITAASLICAAFPAPTTTSGAWYWIYTVVNKLAVNWGHAKSLSAPESAGIVGGPGSISAPLVATSVVPLATASAAQRAVTVVPAVLPIPTLPAPAPAADVVAGQAAAAAFDAKKAAALPPGAAPVA